MPYRDVQHSFMKAMSEKFAEEDHDNELKQIHKANIFISYAREDIEQMRPICNRLKSMSYDVWLDIEKLLPGQDWKLEVEKAIQEADIFLACLSNNSVSKSGYLQKELEKGLEIYDEQPEGRIYLIPVRLDDCKVPEKFRNRNLHWCNLFEGNGLEKLLKAIEYALQEKKNNIWGTGRQASPSL